MYNVTNIEYKNWNFSVQLGVSTYMDYDMKEQLTAVFTPETINLPILYDTYCNPQDIPWEMWRGKWDDLLTNKNLRKGRFLYVFGGGGGYRLISNQ